MLKLLEYSTQKSTDNEQNKTIFVFIGQLFID